MGKLTKRVVEAAQPKAAPYFIWCDALKGFGVRVYKTGRKTFYVDYTASDTGKRGRMKLGDYGVLSVEQARQMAADHRHEVIKGADPILAKQERRSELTVRDLCEQYLAACEVGLVLGKRGTPKKPSTLVSDRSRIEAQIIPLIGSKRVRDITRADITRFVDAVTSGEARRDVKTQKKRGRSVVRGGKGAAARTTGLLGGIFTWAIDRGHATSNPVTGVKRPRDGKRMQRLTPADYHALGKVLNKRGVDPTGARIVVLLALTGCRLGEISKLRWSEVNFDNNRIELGDSKTGRSIRPLTIPVKLLLRQVGRKPGSDFVFPSPRGENAPHGGTRTLVGKIYTESGVPGLTSHILRHAFASVAANTGYATATIAAMLGHSHAGVTAGYMHLEDPVVLAAANAVADRIAGQMDIEVLIYQI
ncbi:tyrosine-type recombinase/integrase [Camelimonas sp. ID_303_24]